MSRSGLRLAFEDGPALVSYIAAGDPDIDATKAYVKALVRGGSDVIELGLPFSEPVAEGPTIQQAVRRALDAGMTPQRYLDIVAELDDEVDVPIVCMTYYNLLYQYGDTPGPAEFVAAAAEAGIDGFVIPDLPVDESDPLLAACREHGVDLVFIVAPTTTEHRLEKMLDRSSGFVYVQGRMGTTGAKDDVSSDAGASLQRLQDHDIPKAVGFGVSAGEHAREIIASGADGVIVGSAYVDLIAEGVENEDVSQDDVASNLEALARELKTGAKKGLPEPESK